MSVSNFQNYFALLLDNVGCLYPMRFGSCLSNPPLLEITPFQSFMLFDRGNRHHKDERLLTLVVVPKQSPLLSAIRDGDKAVVSTLLGRHPADKSLKKAKHETSKLAGTMSQQMSSSPSKQHVGSMSASTKGGLSLSGVSEENLAALMEECCCGNQNIMHVAASNILKIQSQGIPSFSILL